MSPIIVEDRVDFWLTGVKPIDTSRCADMIFQPQPPRCLDRGFDDFMVRDCRIFYRNSRLPSASTRSKSNWEAETAILNLPLYFYPVYSILYQRTQKGERFRVSEASAATEPNYRWIILAILFWAQVFLSMGAYAWGPLGPYFVTEFGISHAQVGMLTSVFYLAGMIIATPSGIMVDRMGARKWLIICLLLMAIPFIAMNFCNFYGLLLGLAAIAGLSYGMLNQVSTKGIMYWFSSKFRATALGLKQAAVPVGGAINGVVLVALATAFHWHRAALLVGILCLIMTLASYILYRERPPEAAEERPPKPIPTSAQKSAQKSPPKQKGGLRAVLRRPELILTMIVMPLLQGGQAGLGSHWVLYLVEDAGYTQALAGICFTVAFIVGAIARPGWGVFSDRILHGDRIKTIIIIAAVALLGSLGATSLLYFGAPIWLAFVAAVFMGAGFLGFQGVIMALTAEIAGTELAGSVSGILTTVSFIGTVTIPIVYGLVSDHWGYMWCWALSALFAAIAVIAYAVFFIPRSAHSEA